MLPTELLLNLHGNVILRDRSHIKSVAERGSRFCWQTKIVQGWHGLSELLGIRFSRGGLTEMGLKIVNSC